MTSNTVAAHLTAAVTVAELIRAHGTAGIPSGKLYALLMPSGLRLDTLKALISMLLKAEIIREPSPFLYVFAK